MLLQKLEQFSLAFSRENSLSPVRKRVILAAITVSRGEDFMSRRLLGPAALAGLALFMLVALGAGSARAGKTVTPSGKPTASRVLFFSSDGMRPDLMEQYAAAGAMPTYKALMAAGVRGANGLEQAFPPNTGVGWYTLMTGTWPRPSSRCSTRSGSATRSCGTTPPSSSGCSPSEPGRRAAWPSRRSSECTS